MTVQGLRRRMRGAMRRLLLLPLGIAPAGLAAEALTRAWDEAEVRVSTRTKTLTFFAPTPILRMRAASLLSKEPETIEWLDSLTPGDVLWDVGANIGLFSLYAAAERSCVVRAFEPSAANYAILARNVQINDLEHRITAYALALAGETCLGVLNLDSTAIGTAMNEFGRAGDKSRYSANTHPRGHGMIGFTIDEFVSRFSPPLPTHIKLDVDGLEWPILQGAIATLKSPQLKSIIVELSITDRAERERSIDLLKSCGLHLKSQGRPQGEPSEQGANHLFVRA
jgi:FkbM family methyltransferase